MIPRILYIASSHGRAVDYHMRKVRPEVPVLGVWIGGIKIKAMTQHVVHNIDAITAFRATHCLVHLMHNDICHSIVHNPEPMSVPEAMFNFYKLVRYLREKMPTVIIIASCPFPRVPKNGFTSSMCRQYNRLAVRAGECMADRRYQLRTLFIPEFWINVKSTHTANPRYLKSVDGLHLTPTAKRLVATRWLSVCHDW